MIDISITVNLNNAYAKCNSLLTSGTVGAICRFDFSQDWDNLSKTAVFVAGGVQRDAILIDDECVIPWEVLEYRGYHLRIGVYGTNAAGTLVIPTVYASCGTIVAGADPNGDESTDPTLPVWAQLLSQIGNLDDLDTEAKNNLVAAINEAAQSGGGGGTSDHSKMTNRDADDQHPISAITGLDSELASKQPVGDYVERSELPDFDEFALKEEIPDVSGFATTEYVNGEVEDLQGQIDAIVSKSDVVDVVGTYIELQNYDTSSIGDKDVVKVLDDETHNNQRSYYRWNVFSFTWNYVGSESVGYTKAETNALLNEKQPTGDYATMRELEEVESKIPPAVTDDHINELIDNKLGVIENGSY